MTATMSSSSSNAPETATTARSGIVNSRSEVERLLDHDQTAPPSYSLVPPPSYRLPSYQASTYDWEVYRRAHELNLQQDMQLTMCCLVLCVLMMSLFVVYPTLGPPPFSIDALRVYVWFGLALLTTVGLALLSMVCKSWLSQNDPSNPRGDTKYLPLVTLLIASGPRTIYAILIFLGLGFFDFLWQHYPLVADIGYTGLDRALATQCICIHLVQDRYQYKQMAKKFTVNYAQSNRV
ncbi:hypothetical protein R3P38DRAFT_1857521 [Favolaschia claudopus]|uniref:Uncharacterized protein n=1 Tax=Favolaschia claudopus TaxID=2862362 RepID=A0AAW0D6P2_9AGAR